MVVHKSKPTLLSLDMAMRTTTSATVETVTFTLDGQSLTVPKGTTVLQAALDHQVKIPFFCYHPKLKPVGSCRMCYVEIEKIPKLMVSCATEATNGMVVHSDSDMVKRGRKGVLEFTLINHPLDCPTCDKGGECDLQDLTFAHGFDDSRFDFQKYRFTDGAEQTTFDDKKIGPEIVLNRNRCILCYKCVRANKEAFGEYDLGAYERGNITEINAAPGEEVSNPFSGNLVEICPVGALTNTDWRYKIRVWLTQQHASLDPYSSSGVNTTYFCERHQNKIFRVTSRRNDSIDDGWLSDVVRYGYQVATAEDRLLTPLIRKNGTQVKATWDEALGFIAKRLAEIKSKRGSKGIAGLISPTLSNESMIAFAALMRGTLGSPNVDYRFDGRAIGKGYASTFAAAFSQPISIAALDTSEVTVVFGSDLHREHHNEYLRLRKAHQFSNAKVFLLNPYSTKASDIATLEVVCNPGTKEHLLNGLCLAAIEMGIVEQPDALKKALPYATVADAATAAGVSADDLRLVAKNLAEARSVSFIAGELVCLSRDRETLSIAMSNLRLAFGLDRKGQIGILSRYSNSRGADRTGVAPELWSSTKTLLAPLGEMNTESGFSTDEILTAMHKGELGALMVIGQNPVMLAPDRNYISEGMRKLDFLVVADLFETETTAMADVVLPLASFGETAGSYTNLEGVVQCSAAGMKPRTDSKTAVELISALSNACGKPIQEKVIQQIAAGVAENVISIPWPSSYLQVVSSADEPAQEYPVSLFIGDDPHHCGHLTEKAPSLNRFAGEAYAEISTDLAHSLKVEDGDPIRIETESSKMILPVRLSKQLDTNVCLIPRNFSAFPVNTLQTRRRRVDRARLSRIEG